MDPEVETEIAEGAEGEGETLLEQPVEGQTTEGSTAPEEEAEDGVVITLGDEPIAAADDEEARAPQWVRELRKSNREKDRRIRELEQKVATPPAAAPADVVVGTKPTLEACEYDAEKFEAQLEAWHTRKREADDQQRRKEDAEKAARADWQGKLDAYGKAKTALKVKDFDDVEEAARDTLSVVQQGVIINGAENAAVLMYALGKNPKKAKELAAIADPVKFAFAVAKLEAQLKVTPRKTAPLPERVVRGSAPMTGTVDTTLEKLRAEADRTGDRSKVSAYIRQKQQKAA